MASSNAIPIVLRKAASKAARQLPSQGERELLVQIALAELQKQQYSFVKNIGGGSFGDVVSVSTPDRAKIQAAKILFSALTSAGELESWPHLTHPNILSVDKIIYKEVFNIFITKYHPRNLESTLESQIFTSDPQCFRSLKRWLMDILSGLEYLHSSNLVHLDLKLNNVLLSVEDHAVICDFGFLTSLKHQPIRKTGLPYVLLPPEIRINERDKQPVDGIAYDIWAFGMLAFLCFTGQWFDITTVRRFIQANWEASVYPLIFQELQLETFIDIFRTEFCSLWTSKRSLCLAHNLLQGVLRFNPKARPKVCEIKGHALFTGDDDALFEPDFIWDQDIEFERELTNRRSTPLSRVRAEVQSIIAQAVQEVERKNFNIDARIHRLNKEKEMEDSRKHCTSEGKDDDEAATECSPLLQNALRAEIQQIMRNAAEEVRKRKEEHDATPEELPPSHSEIEARIPSIVDESNETVVEEEDPIEDKTEGTNKKRGLFSRVGDWLRKKRDALRALNCCCACHREKE